MIGKIKSRTRWPVLVGRAALGAVIGIVLSCQPQLTGQSNSVQPGEAQQKFTLERTLTDDSVIYSVAFAPDGETVASHNVGNVVKLWDVQTGALKQTLTGDSNKNVQPNSLAFAPDGKTLASGSGGSANLWNVQTGALLRTLAEDGNRFNVVSVAFAPDGMTLAGGGWDNAVKLWDARTGALRRTLTGHTKAVFAVAFAPDGNTLASGSEDGTVKLWNAQTGALERFFGYSQNQGGDSSRGTSEKTLQMNPSGVLSLAFASDGKTIATGHKDGSVRLWDVQTNLLIRTLKGEGFINSVVFAPDGKILVGGLNDNTVRLWDVQTGGLNQTLTGHGISVISVAISPDGKRVASGSIDKTVKLWRINVD